MMVPASVVTIAAVDLAQSASAVDAIWMWGRFGDFHRSAIKRDDRTVATVGAPDAD